MNGNTDIGEVLHLKYSSYTSLKRSSTKNYAMVSELIDNSISSKEEYEGSDITKWKKPLTILIELRVKSHKTKKKFLKNFYGMEVVNETNLTIIDNAYGIKKNRIVDALTLDKKVTTKSKLNVHGRGLKQSAFWWGIDLIITTMTENGEFYQVPLCLSKQGSEGQNSSIVVQTFNLNEEKIRDYKKATFDLLGNTNSGTVIRINKLHPEEDRCLTQNNFETMMKFIAFKYKKFLLHKDKFSIKVSYKNNNKLSKDWIRKSIVDLEHNDEKGKIIDLNIPTTKEFFLNYNPNLKPEEEKWTLKEIKKIFNIKYDTWLEGLKKAYLFSDDDSFNNDELNKDEVSKKICKLCNNFKDWIIEELDHLLANKKESSLFKKDFYLEFPISHFKLKPLKITIWAINEPRKKTLLKGIWIFEANRAIYHPPNYRGEMGTWDEWEDKVQPTGNTNNIFGGEFSIDSLNIMLSHDKMKILWDKIPNLKEYIMKAFHALWKTFDILVVRGIRANCKKPDVTTKGINEKVLLENLEDKIKSLYSGHVESVIEPIKNKEKQIIGFRFMLEANHEELIIEIYLNHNSIKNEDIFEEIKNENNEKDNVFKFRANLGHNYFRKLSYETNRMVFYVEVVVPPIILVTTKMWAIFNERFNKKDMKKIPEKVLDSFSANIEIPKML